MYRTRRGSFSHLILSPVSAWNIQRQLERWVIWLCASCEKCLLFSLSKGSHRFQPGDWISLGSGDESRCSLKLDRYITIQIYFPRWEGEEKKPSINLVWRFFPSCSTLIGFPAINLNRSFRLFLPSFFFRFVSFRFARSVSTKQTLLDARVSSVRLTASASDQSIKRTCLPIIIPFHYHSRVKTYDHASRTSIPDKFAAIN